MGNQVSNSRAWSVLASIRHDLGNEFVYALDDIRQKVVEEGWSGRAATPSHDLKDQFHDPIAALYGKAAAPADPEAWTPTARESTAVAYNQAKAAGAGNVVREIEASVPADVLGWLRHPGKEQGEDAMGRTRAREAGGGDGLDWLRHRAEKDASGVDPLGRTKAEQKQARDEEEAQAAYDVGAEHFPDSAEL